MGGGGVGGGRSRGGVNTGGAYAVTMSAKVRDEQHEYGTVVTASGPSPCPGLPSLHHLY